MKMRCFLIDELIPLWDDLRAFLNYLEEKKEMATIREEVDVKCEISAGLQKTCKIGGPALYFKNVRGHRIPVVGGVYATEERVLSILGTTKESAPKDFLHGMENEVHPTIVSKGPCQEVVWLGEEVDLAKLPILTHAPKDGGPYVTSIVIAKDPEYGRNVSIHRCMVKGKNKLALVIDAGQHLGAYYQRSESMGRPLEVAIVIGTDPIIPIASQTVPIKGIYGDELAVAGGLRGKPVELVRCRTVDIEVPATVEIVIEGEVPPNVREMEGPFGEMSGYYGAGVNSPIIIVKAITTREEPIYHAIHPGRPPNEGHNLRSIPVDASFYRYIRQACPTVKAVHFTSGGIGQNHVVISIKQTYKEQAKNVMLAAYGSRLDVKNVVVVDEDIDVYDPVEVEWAIATRAHPDTDVYVFPRVAGGPADPSAKEDCVVSGMAIDATKPFGEPFPETIELPEPKFRIPA